MTFLAITGASQLLGQNPDVSRLPSTRINQAEFSKIMEFNQDGTEGKYGLYGKSTKQKLELDSARYTQTIKFSPQEKQITLFGEKDEPNSLKATVETYKTDELRFVVDGTSDSITIKNGGQLADGWTSTLREISKNGEEVVLEISFFNSYPTAKEIRKQVDTLDIPLGVLKLTYEDAPPYEKIEMIPYGKYTIQTDQGEKVFGDYSRLWHGVVKRDSLSAKSPNKIFADNAGEKDVGEFISTYNISNGKSEAYYKAPGAEKYVATNVMFLSLRGPPADWSRSIGWLNINNNPITIRDLTADPTYTERLSFTVVWDAGKEHYYIKDGKFNHVNYNKNTKQETMIEEGITSHLSPYDSFITRTEDNGHKLIIESSLSDSGDVRPHLAKYSPITSVHDNQPVESTLRIYPNPVTDNLTLERERMGQATLVITNNLGQTVYKSLVEAGDPRKSLRVSDMPDGMYFIRVVYPDGEVEYQKFIKIHK